MKKISSLFVVLFFSSNLFAQDDQTIAADKLIPGIWKGSSICQQKNSPCHSETVVYHFTLTSPGHYDVQANKIVNGVEEDMGVLHYVFDPKKNSIIAHYRAEDTWELLLKGNDLEGTLIVNNVLYRIIKVTKQR